MELKYFVCIVVLCVCVLMVIGDYNNILYIEYYSNISILVTHEIVMIIHVVITAALCMLRVFCMYREHTNNE